MRYVRALALPLMVAIVGFVVLAVLELQAQAQYFSGGPGQEFGEVLWTTSLSQYTPSVVMIPVALWAGYRGASIAGTWIAGLWSGVILTAALGMFGYVFLLFSGGGASQVSELFSKPPVGLFWLLVQAIVAGLIGAHLAARRASAT